MSDYDAISPEEAGRQLSNFRWQRDRSPEQTASKEDLTEADVRLAGVEKSQGFERMTLVNPTAPDLGDLSTPDETFGPKEAADFVQKRRDDGVEISPEVADQLNQPEVREYKDVYGRKQPDNLTVSPEQAAFELGQAREAEATAKLTALEQQLINQLDQIAGQPRQTEPQPEIPPELSQQHPEAAAGEQPDKLTRLLQENPELLQTVQAYQTQSEQQVALAQHEAQQYAAAVQQQYAAVVSQNATAALAGLVAQFPELGGLQTQQDLQIAVQTISRTNPDRGRAITDYIGRVSGLVSEAQRVQEARQAAIAQYQQQQYAAAQEQFQRSAEAVDSQFDAYALTQVSQEQYKEIQKEVRPMLRDYGLSDQDMTALWNTPYLRSFASQAMIMDAARWRLAQNGAKTKAVKPVPTVQRPGSPAARGSEADYSLGKLQAQLDRSGSAKDAANYLVAKRAAARR